MASGKRPKFGIRNKSDHSYTSGEIVWAKLRGYTPWPAKITSVSSKIVNLEFFADHKTASLYQHYIIPFKSYEPLPTKRQLFNEAYSEAKKCLLPDDEASKLRALRLDLELKRKEALSVYNDIDRIIDLKDVQLLEIIDTFSVYRDILENIFQSNRHIPDRIIKPNFDWLLISHSLISSSQQTEMYRKIRSELVIENSISSSYENLIWTWIIPEWSLQIFMHKFNFSRTDALSHLKKQDLYCIHNLNSPL